MELIYTTDITLTCYIGILLHNTKKQVYEAYTSMHKNVLQWQPTAAYLYKFCISAHYYISPCMKAI